MPQLFIKCKDLFKFAVLCYITVHCLKFYFVGLLTATAIICHPRPITQHFHNRRHLQTTSTILTLRTRHAVMVQKYTTLSGKERGHGFTIRKSWILHRQRRRKTSKKMHLEPDEF